MKFVFYTICLVLAVFLGVGLGFFGKNWIDDAIQLTGVTDLHLSSNEIVKRMQAKGLVIPEKSYALEYYYQGASTDWRKMIAFTSGEKDLRRTVENFIRENGFEQKYEFGKDANIPWPIGPEWWPSRFERATIYIGNGYSLGHDTLSHRVYLEVYSY